MSGKDGTIKKERQNKYHPQGLSELTSVLNIAGFTNCDYMSYRKSCNDRISSTYSAEIFLPSHYIILKAVYELSTANSSALE